MITPQDIVDHLRTYIPAFTNLFHDEISGATATASGTTVTVTATAHGLSVGQKVVISAGKLSNLIASAVDNGDGTVRFETTDEHDLTEPKAPLDPTTLTLDGFPESVWNAEFNIVSIPNRKHLEVELPDGVSTLPTLGSGVLLESRPAGIIGAHTVATVPDANTFTVEITGAPTLPTGSIDGVTVISSSPRIFGVANIDKAEALYSRVTPTVTKNAIFVMMMNADVSKDRHTLNDGVASFVRGNIGKQIILQNFAVVGFFPSEDDQSGFVAQNQAYGEVYRALASVLYGFEFDDPDTKQKFVTVNNGHGPGVYRNAYYTHVYDWQIPSVVTFENGFNLQPDVAFRDIASTWDLDSDDMAQLELNIDLDEEPL